jgi:hypothetical protein
MLMEVSKEHIASIFKVEQAEHDTTLEAGSKSDYHGLHGVISQMIVIFL